MHPAGVAHLALNPGAEMHLYRRRFSRRRHADARKNQCSEQRQRKAQAQQKIARGKDMMYEYHEVDFGH